MRAIIFLLVLAAVAVLGLPSVAAGSCAGLWFETAQTGRVALAEFEADLQCMWHTGLEPSALQRSGACGLPAQANDLIVLTHNPFCSSFECSIERDTVAGIALLETGDAVGLCVGTRLYTGRVVWSARVYQQATKPQDEFECANNTCGILVTSVGKIDASGNIPYHLVRVQYR